MEIIKRNRLIVNNEEVRDELLEDLITRHIEATIEFYQKRIDDAINELKHAFVEKGYSEDELIAEIVNKIFVYSESYSLDTHLFVYPRMHPNVYKSRNAIEINMSYMSADYTKEINELGKQTMLNAQLLLYKTENEKLKKELEEVRDDRNRLMDELEKCREKCGEQAEEDP